MSVTLANTDLHGKGVRSHRTGPFTLWERQYAANFQSPRHAHDNALFCYVVRGGYTATYGSRTRACQPSTFLFHAAGETHAEHFNRAGGCSLIVEIENSWLDRLREHSRIISTSADFDGGLLIVLARRLYREFLEMDEISPLVIEGLIFEMVGETSRSAACPSISRPPLWLERAREFLHDRFSEPITLAEIAQEVGIHPAHLSQVFHKHYNCTIGTYLRRRRIDFACQSLASTDLPLSRIALEAGFSDQSHLTRTFKQHIGMPPAQYRDLLRKS